ncbi:hypothetical protein Pyn_21749 [Prunus yedoensis var. nudiflora]|uniref:Uncharacterized protein n=1 Tax=Prunus yedoensis var. nudiflora TaxID=2094558 RepID=A0A314UC48_PRUYE|nr:hypothetical protein Pyn_21749 [Prunus yedoensis var. nudiflora]
MHVQIEELQTEAAEPNEEGKLAVLPPKPFFKKPHAHKIPIVKKPFTPNPSSKKPPLHEIPTVKKPFPPPVPIFEKPLPPPVPIAGASCGTKTCSNLSGSSICGATTSPFCFQVGLFLHPFRDSRSLFLHILSFVNYSFLCFPKASLVFFQL